MTKRTGTGVGATQLGLELPIVGRAWPDPARFPHNAEGNEVGARLEADLIDSVDPLVVTGYASVERILGLLHRMEAAPRGAEAGTDAVEGPARIRLLIGVEPTPMSPGAVAARARWLTDPDQEVTDYWLAQGISITQWPALLGALRLLDAGRLEVRTSGGRRIHAKMYVGDAGVTLGSSNYTEPGLRGNLEANARFSADGEPERYREATDLAENLWTLGADFTERFRDLLSELLLEVGWQEALARACGEILEGDWMARAPIGDAADGVLWPSQRQGIAQALWILENVGAVLVADATGAGKTRMGAHLVRALCDRNWRTGRSASRHPMLVGPPAMRERWLDELVEAGQLVDVRSHGVLSQPSAREREVVERALEQTQLLVVDEAHNFLNRASVRSKLLYGNGADHVILLTATPINRGASDLLSIVDLLGADNFDDDVLAIVGRLGRRGRRTPAMEAGERERLRGALQHFVVRRTKREFNELIDRDPDAYRNALGEPCRFPAHVARTYPRDDPPDDRALALRIREAAEGLRGIINLRTIEMPRFMAMEGWTEDRFVEMRLKGARALAGYQIRSKLRSSRAALIEHLSGTAEATARLGIGSVKSSPTGDVLGTLSSIRGTLPKVRLETDVTLPEWLTDPDRYARAVDEEIAVYGEILDCVGAMSDHRLVANARYLLALLDRHERILAFDSHVISLHALKGHLEGRDDVDVALATGEGSMASRMRFAERFGLEAAGSRLVGLCSDALAEGLNLQGASAVVHLDLPTVIRVLEQRIGRVDRMDSPHAEVEVHWPQEPPEFQLRADDRLLMRLRDVEDLLGSNVPLPDELSADAPERATAGHELEDGGEGLALEDVIQAVEESLEVGPDVTLADAFARVRRLVSGEEALLPAEIYDRVRGSTAHVLSSVSVVRAEREWAFLAVGASDRGVPRWLLVDAPAGPDARVTGVLDDVAAGLRARLEDMPVDLGFDEHAAEVLDRALAAARRHRRELLPIRKRRALEEMGAVLEAYRRRATDPDRIRVIDDILRLAESRADQEVDIERLASWWLQLVRPEWIDHLSRPRIRRPARMQHLRRRLKREEIDTDRLRTYRDVLLRELPLERRVVAAIVGLAEG